MYQESKFKVGDKVIVVFRGGEDIVYPVKAYGEVNAIFWDNRGQVYYKIDGILEHLFYESVIYPIASKQLADEHFDKVERLYLNSLTH